MIIKLNNWLRSKRGQGLVEYALILALIVVVAMVSLSIIGNKANNAMTAVSGKLT